MAPPFVFKIGQLDLSSYVRVNPDDSMDPYGQDWLQPAFSETPFNEGQVLLSTTVGARETVWPLFLSDPSRLKDQLHTLIQQITIAAGQKPLTAEWRDAGASNSTFFDLNFLRFEPSFNFRRSEHGYGAGVLRLYIAGYGHTGTLRIAATAAGTGLFLSVPIGSIAGDAPALLDTRIAAGAVLPSLGRIVGLAPIPHPSYTALIPAASLSEPQAGATLVSSTTGQGGKCLLLPVSPTGGASGIACKVPLANPTIMGGDNRLLAVVNSGLAVGVGITALDPYGNQMGPTAVASMTSQWGLIDLGVCRLPTVGFPTRPEISIQAGGVWASGAAGPGQPNFPGNLAINEVICLPDKNLSLVLEANGVAGSAISRDPFSGNLSTLNGSNDSFGNAWSPAYNNAHSGAANNSATGALLREVRGVLTGVFQTGTTALVDGDHLAAIHTDAMLIAGKVAFASPGLGFEELRLFKDVRASQFVQARLAASGFLSLEAATGAGAGAVLGSVAIATLSAAANYRLLLDLQGPAGFVNLSRDDGGPVFRPGSAAFASVGIASNAAIAGAGVPAVAMAVASNGGFVEGAAQTLLSSWEVNTIPSSNLQAYDAYRFDGPDADVYRTASSGVFAGQKLTAYQRGAFPKAAPSTSSIAIVCAPYDQGVANDTISAVISVKERFFYAR